MSVCLSVADLEDGGLLALQRDRTIKEYDDLSHFTFLKFGSCSLEKVKKTVLFERILDHTHSLTNSKVSSRNTRIV